MQERECKNLSYFSVWYGGHWAINVDGCHVACQSLNFCVGKIR